MKISLQRISFILFISIGLVKPALSQSIQVFPNADPEHYGFYESMITYKDSLYFKYVNTPNPGQEYIGKFGGAGFSIIPAPGQVYGSPVVYNNQLFYVFQNAQRQLGRITSNGTVELLANPDSGPGFHDKCIVFNGKLYFLYASPFNGNRIAVYDGNSISLLNNPDVGGFIHTPPVVYNGSLYWVYKTVDQQNLLAKIDGNTISLYGNAGNGPGIISKLNLYNNKICFNFNDVPGQFDGTTLSTLSMPPGFTIISEMAVNAGRLWFEARNFNNQFQLAYYNGTGVNLFGTPYSYNFRFYDPIVYKGKIHFRFDDGNYSSMARVDEDSIKVFPRLGNNDPGYAGNPVVYNDNLYFSYSKQSETIRLGKYDGENFYLFPHPPNTSAFFVRDDAPVIHKGSLFFGYGKFGQGQGPQVMLAKLTDTIVLQPICANDTALLISDVTGAGYQWQVKQGAGFVNLVNTANYNSVNGPMLSITNAPSNWYGYQYRCVVAGNYSRTFSLKFSNNWTGAVNNLWEEPGNWSCGSVPEMNTDVIIGAGTIVINSNVTIRTLSVVAPATVTVVTGNTLTILH